MDRRCTLKKKSSTALTPPNASIHLGMPTPRKKRKKLNTAQMVSERSSIQDITECNSVNPSRLESKFNPGGQCRPKIAKLFQIETFSRSQQRKNEGGDKQSKLKRKRSSNEDLFAILPQERHRNIQNFSKKKVESQSKKFQSRGTEIQQFEDAEEVLRIEDSQEELHLEPRTVNLESRSAEDLNEAKKKSDRMMLEALENIAGCQTEELVYTEQQCPTNGNSSCHPVEEGE